MEPKGPITILVYAKDTDSLIEVRYAESPGQAQAVKATLRASRYPADSFDIVVKPQ